MVWYYDSKWKALENTQTFDDPLQGNQGNCTFIAALCSAVWKNYARPDFNPLNPTPEFKLPFYDNGLKEVYVTGKLSCTSNNPDWAKSKDFLPSSNLYEIWPSLYEKAYGAFCKYLEDQSFGLGPHDDLIEPIPWITDIRALEHLTNKTRSQQFYAADYADNVAQIKTFCLATGVAMNPMLAWTFSTQIVKGFDGVILMELHTYSVLGVSPKKLGATHIVLRNPKGGDFGPAVSWNNININKNGVFKINKDDFKKYFNYYQYVI